METVAPVAPAKTITIYNRWSGAVLWVGEADSLREGTQRAVEAKANLRGADLGGADLRGADLGGAGTVCRAGRVANVWVSNRKDPSARLAKFLTGAFVDLSDAEWASFVASDERHDLRTDQCISA